MRAVRGARVRIAIWLALALAFALGVGLAPLFGVLGFELALATAVLAAIAGLDLGAALARARQRMEVSVVHDAGFVGRTTARATLTAVAVAVGVTTVPGVVAAIRGAWQPTCDWTFGLVAYAALPLATAALAGALGHAIGTLTGPRRFVGALAAQVPFVALAFAGLYRFYAAPPVFSFDPIIGYFPGNLYDENVQLGSALAWARLAQALAVIAIVALVAWRLDVPTGRVRFRAPRPLGRRLGALAVAVACGGGAVALHLLGGTLGFAIDADDIADELGGTLETEHFTIHYARTPEIVADLPLIAADHEFRYAQVVATLGAAPPGKLTSFYFANRDQKARWMGARDVEMAKPWRREIYVDHRAFPHSSLRHEIAHAVASAFGDPLFGVAARRVAGLPLLVNPGLVEGLAVAADWPGGYDHPTPHESVRAMAAAGMQPSIADLLSLRFLTVSSARGYTTAGSFLRFLLDRYGAARLRALYGSGGDFEAAYGQPLATLEAEWRAMIATIALPPEAVEASRERFRAGSVFARPCPHATAARREDAQRAYAGGDRAGAVALARGVCGDDPEEPRFRLELGDYLVGGDPAERAEAEAIWAALAKDDAGTTAAIRAEALERLARVAAYHRDDAGVRRAIAAARALPVDGTQRRQLAAETYALDHAGPAGYALRGYFFGLVPGLDPPLWARLAALAEPALAMPHYLLGLQRANQVDWRACADELATAALLGLPDPQFAINGARRLAVCAFRVHDRGRVELAIGTLAAGSTADRLLAADWAARLSHAAEK